MTPLRANIINIKRSKKTRCMCTALYDVLYKSEGWIDLTMMVEKGLVCTWYIAITALTTGSLCLWGCSEWFDCAWWRHQKETFFALLPFVWGIHRSPVNSHHKGQRRGTLMHSLICAWTNDGVNNRYAGDIRRQRAHYDVIVMMVEKGLMWAIPALITGSLCLWGCNQVSYDFQSLWWLLIALSDSLT